MAIYWIRNETRNLHNNGHALHKRNARHNLYVEMKSPVTCSIFFKPGLVRLFGVYNTNCCISTQKNILMIYNLRTRWERIIENKDE